MDIFPGFAASHAMDDAALQCRKVESLIKANPEPEKKGALNGNH